MCGLSHTRDERLCGFPLNDGGDVANRWYEDSMTVQPFTAALRNPGRTALNVLAIATILVLSGISIDHWAVKSAAEVARLAARERVNANAGLFESELQKYRLLPLVLSENSDVVSILSNPTKNKIGQLNEKFRFLAEKTGTEVIYLVDASGSTIASSNYHLPTSFVGTNFSFRPYFKEALKNSSSEYFARGLVSGQPGLFFAQSVSGRRGVVVAKVSLERLETEWAKQIGFTLIRDRDGFVTAANNRDWVLHPTRPLSPTAQREAKQTQQFGTTLPAALSFTLPPPGNERNNEGNIVFIPPDGRYALASTRLRIADWTLSSLEPLDSALYSARLRAQVIGLFSILVLVVGFGLIMRSVERRRMLVVSQQNLEKEVTRQTAELRATNQRLVHEVAEREKASRRLRKARDELTQANRLASIGQITAGVAHEINQPVAAIRTFAENAKILMTRVDLPQTSKNLDLIIDLTRRIGDITTELRSFAKRAPPPIGMISLADAFDGALILLSDRLRADGVALSIPDNLRSIAVLADRVRLEQVIINLLQNSLDALVEVNNPTIEVRLQSIPDSSSMQLIFDDNGSGLTESMRRTLFEPFVTGKVNGLGLGLGISRNIARDFGGELDVTESRLGGAAFSLKLQIS